MDRAGVFHCTGDDWLLWYSSYLISVCTMHLQYNAVNSQEPSHSVTMSNLWYPRYKNIIRFVFLRWQEEDTLMSIISPLVSNSVVIISKWFLMPRVRIKVKYLSFKHFCLVFNFELKKKLRHISLVSVVFSDSWEHMIHSERDCSDIYCPPVVVFLHRVDRNRK